MTPVTPASASHLSGCIWSGYLAKLANQSRLHDHVVEAQELDTDDRVRIARGDLGNLDPVALRRDLEVGPDTAERSGVAAGTTVDPVVAGAAPEHVIASAAPEHVIASAAEQPVVAALRGAVHERSIAIKGVIPVAANK